MHSSDGGAEYGDQVGYMGFSYIQDDTPRMCFNGAKSSNLGWYSDRETTLGFCTQDLNRQLVGVNDYATAGSESVILKIEKSCASCSNVYVMFNSATGINVGTQEGKNQVVITTETSESEVSILVAKLGVKLGDTQSYSYTGDVNGVTKTTTITVNSIDTDATPPVASVSVTCTTAQTAAPTSAPTSPPTAPPTLAPISPPTAPPILTPTSPPTAPPTLAPTPSPPTVSPTFNPTAAPTRATPTVSPTSATPTLAPVTDSPTTAPTPTVNPPPITEAPVYSPTTAPTLSPDQVVDVVEEILDPEIVNVLLVGILSEILSIITGSPTPGGNSLVEVTVSITHTTTALTPAQLKEIQESLFEALTSSTVADRRYLQADDSGLELISVGDTTIVDCPITITEPCVGTANEVTYATAPITTSAPTIKSGKGSKSSKGTSSPTVPGVTTSPTKAGKNGKSEKSGKSGKGRMRI
jgi:hypothetical protein